MLRVLFTGFSEPFGASIAYYMNNGTVDQETLFDLSDWTQIKLKANMREGLDYVYVSTSAW